MSSEYSYKNKKTGERYLEKGKTYSQQQVIQARDQYQKDKKERNEKFGAKSNESSSATTAVSRTLRSEGDSSVSKKDSRTYGNFQGSISHEGLSQLSDDVFRDLVDRGVLVPDDSLGW